MKLGKILKLLVFVSLVLLVVKVSESDLFKIKTLNIDGNYSLIKEDIVDKLDVIKGQSIFAIKSNLLRNEIDNDARVKEISISKKYPDTVSIHIDQREPIAIVSVNDEYLYVDEKLNIFAYYDEIKKDDVPIITVNQDRELGMQEMMQILHNLYESELYPLVSEIYYKDGYRMTLLDGTNVFITEYVTTKKYNFAVKAYNQEKKEKNLEYIDLRFKDIAIK